MAWAEQSARRAGDGDAGGGAQLGDRRLVPALDRAWILTGFELYLRSTQGCGWTDEAYERWLAALLLAQLCGADTAGEPR